MLCWLLIWSQLENASNILSFENFLLYSLVRNLKVFDFLKIIYKLCKLKSFRKHGIRRIIQLKACQLFIQITRSGIFFPSVAALLAFLRHENIFSKGILFIYLSLLTQPNPEMAKNALNQR